MFIHTEDSLRNAITQTHSNSHSTTQPSTINPLHVNSAWDKCASQYMCHVSHYSCMNIQDLSQSKNKGVQQASGSHYLQYLERRVCACVRACVRVCVCCVRACVRAYVWYLYYQRVLRSDRRPKLRREGLEKKHSRL